MSRRVDLRREVGDVPELWDNHRQALADACPDGPGVAAESTLEAFCAAVDEFLARQVDI